MSSHRPRGLWSIALRWSLVSGLCLALAMVFLQSLRWKEYALEATVLLAQKTTNRGKLETLLELGAICNSLNDFVCSEHYFRKVVTKKPNHKTALANLAIALCHQKKWKEARSHLEGYFSLGGDAYDVLLWYGEAISALEGADKALDWYYFSLAMNPLYVRAADRLVEHLVKLNRFQEALSIIGAMTQGQPHLDRFWRKKMDQILRTLTYQGIQHRPQRIRLPALAGGLHYIPVFLRSGGRMQMIPVNLDSEETFINLDTFKENYFREPASASFLARAKLSKPQGANLNYLQLGPWTLGGQEVLICRDCPNSIGRNTLRALSYHTSKSSRTQFIQLEKQ